MKAKPILFSGEMVRAILEGRKTQTRRVVKPQPDSRHCRIDFEDGLLKESSLVAGCWDVWKKTKCPFGKPGDLLYVRETWSYPVPGCEPQRGVSYKADHVTGNDGPTKITWKPSIHMPRSFSRLTLKVTSIRVERLQDITEEDAVTEGCKNDVVLQYDENDKAIDYLGLYARERFDDLWDSSYGKPRKDGNDISWSANPWVWVISFSIIPKNIDEVLSDA